MAGTLTIEHDGPVAVLTFDQQTRRNAITAEMWRAIPERVRELEQAADVRVVVMRGAGDVAFVSGADISEFTEARTGPDAEAYDAANVEAFTALASLEKPLIAMVHGFCIGGGVAIALCADLRYAADDGLFAIPAARLGLGYPASGLKTLIEVVGEAHAKEMFFTAQRYTAEQALGLGLLNGVYPKAELEQEVMKLAHKMARNAPLTLRAAKLAMQQLKLPEGKRDPAAVAAAISRCYASDDYKEGVAAFLGKRSPVFRGT